MKGADRILGATVVATHGGAMISQITQAMTYGLGLNKLADVIRLPHPVRGCPQASAASTPARG